MKETYIYFGPFVKVKGSEPHLGVKRCHNCHTDTITDNKLSGFCDNCGFLIKTGDKYMVAPHVTYLDSDPFKAVNFTHHQIGDEAIYLPNNFGIRLDRKLYNDYISIGNKENFINSESFDMNSFWDLNSEFLNYVSDNGFVCQLKMGFVFI